MVLLAAWWTKGRCLLDGAWQGGEQYLGWCYTDIYPLWFAERLNEGATPYLDHPVEYPVLIGAQMWVVAAVTRLLVGPAAEATAFYHLTALLTAPFWVAAVVMLRRMAVPASRLLWLAAAPTLLVYGFMNWDAVAVALFTGALLAHRRGADRLAGVLAGLGAATKLFPAFVVPVVVISRLRRRDVRGAVEHTVAAALAWLAVNVPVALAAPAGWRRFFQLNRERPADFDSLWYVVGEVRNAGWDTAVVNRWSALLFLAGAVVITVVGLRRLPVEQTWRLVLPWLVWFLLTNKVYSPQYSLWLLPAMALALPSAPAYAAFAVADLAVFVVRYPFFGGLAEVQPAPDYGVLAWMLVIRAAALVWVLMAAVRRGPAPEPAAPPPQPGAGALASPAPG